MAIVTKVTESRDATLNTVSNSGSRTFLVFFDEYLPTDKYSNFIDQASQAIDPISGLKVPRQGSNFDGDAPVKGDPIATSVSVRQYQEQNIIWEVSVKFSESTRESSDNDDNVWQDYPWNETPTVVWGSSIINQLILTDFDGRAIVNSAGDAFDTAITRPVALMTVSCTFNKKAGGYTPQSAAALVNTVNESDFTVFGTKVEKGTALMKTYGGSKLTAVVNGEEVNYWQVTAAWDILSNASSTSIGWDGIVLDIGTQQTINGSGKFTINDKHGYRLSSPQLLNGNGHRLERAEGGYNSRAQNPNGLRVISDISSNRGVFLRYKQYETKSHRNIAS